MTGFERNAEVVHMTAYAPLLAHVNAWQWRLDLIWFDNLNCLRTPNYYVQQLFAANAGTALSSIILNGKPITGQDKLYASAVIDEKNNTYIIKIVNVETKTQPVRIGVESFQKMGDW